MEPTLKMLVDIAQGNPGAITVLKKLEWYSRWFEMIRFLHREGPKGGELWCLYKDKHHQDIDRVAREIEERMSEDKEFKHYYDNSVKPPKFIPSKKY